MKRIISLLLIIATALLSALIFSSCSPADEKTALKVIIVPKFEIDEMTGDFPGEAQLFYEKYCKDCEETEISNMPKTGRFYVNEENGVGILITGSGKTAAGLALMALLSSDSYDCSGAYIVSVGCSGGSSEYCTLGDVVLATAVCDYDIGHHVDAHEKENSENHVMWFPDDLLTDYEFELLNGELCENAFSLIKDIPLQTTEEAKTVMKENFPARAEADILPAVKKGTFITGDNYWKGIYGHETANFIANYYECPDPYAVSEMEDVAIANTAQCFDMLDRVIMLRVIVNLDTFFDGETPESTWGEYDSYGNRVKEDNDETLDIFEPAMHNLYDTGSIVVDSLLDGSLH